MSMTSKYNAVVSDYSLVPINIDKAFLLKLRELSQQLFIRFGEDEAEFILHSNQEGLLERMSLICATLKYYLSIEISDAQIRAAYNMLTGIAIDFAGHPGMHISVLFSACLLGLKRVKTHVICLNDELTCIRESSFRPVFQALGIQVSVITRETSISQRESAYASDIVFCSAKERALDGLRISVKNDLDSDPVEQKLGFLKTKNRIFQNFSINYSEFALVEDIDLILVDAIMTPVHLLKPGVDPGNLEITEDEIIASSSFHKIFSKYVGIGGVGVRFDQFANQCLEQYGIPQIKLEKIMQTSPLTAHQFLPNISDFVNETLRLIMTAVERNQIVIVDGCPEDEREKLIRRLREEAIQASQIHPNELLQSFLNKPKSRIGCYITTHPIASLVEISVQCPKIQMYDLVVVSLSCSKSYCTEQKRSDRVRQLFAADKYEKILALNNEDIGIPKIIIRLLLLLPKIVVRCVVSSLILHKQKEYDRHRFRSNQALLRYEREIDDLIAFSG